MGIVVRGLLPGSCHQIFVGDNIKRHELMDRKTRWWFDSNKAMGSINYQIY